MLKKSISIILTVTLLMSIIIVAPFSSSAAEVGSNEDIPGISNNMSVVGTNSFGQMLSSEIGDKQAEQEENDNCIISVEMEESTATVEYQASQDATLVVAIYSDDETQMLASGQIDVSHEEDNAQLTIDIETMPQYFYLKAYLIDKECYRPICTVYESSLYTQEMQEFLAKSTDDFDVDKVLNLDEDKDNNFAVFNDNVEIINQKAGVNEVVSADEGSKTYTIEKADDSITSLQIGDIFTYAYDDTVLIIKVKSISIDGTTAIIQGDEMDLEEAFDYIKIEGSSSITEENYDDTDKDELLIYDGITSENNSDNSAQNHDSKSLEPVGAREGDEWNWNTTATYTFDENKCEKEYSLGKIAGKISGSVNITINTKIKYLLSLTKFYFEFSVKASIQYRMSMSISGELSFKLGHFGFIPITGVWVSFTPSIVFEGSAELQFTGTMECSIGFRASPKGIENISTKPVLKAEAKIELKIFFGLSLKPEISIFGILVKASAEAKLGVELTMSLKGSLQTDDGKPKDNTKIHECKYCCEGDMYLKGTLSFEIKILNLEKWKFKRSLEVKSKLCDLHYSFDFNEFGFSKCQHYKYLTVIKVVDAIGQPIKDATVSESNKTNKTNLQGITYFYLPNGEHEIKIQSSQGDKTEKIKIDNAPNAITIKTDFYGAAGNIAQLEISDRASMALTKDGDIYLWGCWGSDYDDVHWFASQNDGSEWYIKRPMKLDLSSANISKGSIKQIGCGYHWGAILLKDGSLYTFGGRSNWGQLGNGTTQGSGTPQRIMDNVKSICISESAGMAITNDNELFMWGGNGDGNFCIGTSSSVLSPVKVMDNVKFANTDGSYHLAIKTDGTLYGWGRRYELRYYSTISGSYTVKIIDQPHKILENVRFAQRYGTLADKYTYAAIKEDGSLYMWGDNSYGQLGIGNYTKQANPVFVSSNISQIKIHGFYTTVTAMDYSGNLYTWGDGSAAYNRLGDGTSGSRSRPNEIMNNVASFAAYYTHTLVLTKEGKIIGYGDNASYALGDGTNTEYKTEIIECLLTKSTTSTSSPKKSIASVGADGDGETDDPEINTTAPIVKAMNFSNLKPSEVYNVYSVADKAEDYLISQQNLKYINQVVTDENGSINLDYIPTENVENSFEFAVPLEQTDISEMRIVESEYTFNGEEQYYLPLVLNGDDLLEIGKDYIVTGQPYATAPGEYAVEIVGKGLYKGAVSKTFIISSANINEVTVSLASGYPTYDGTEKEPALSITYRGLDLTENVDYTVTYRNNINAGTAYADIEGIGYYSGSKTYSFSIQPIYLDESCISPNVIDYQLYNRETLVPDIKVVYNGKELVKGTDYEIDCYSDETYGYVDVYAYGKGNYSGWMRVNIRGDIDQDSRVTGRDLVLLQQYLNSTPEEREELWLSVEAADVNADGEVNDFDVTALREFLKSHRVSDDIRPENSESDSSIKKISVSPDEASVGETISVPITIANNQGFCYLRMSFNYNESKLAFLNAENGEVSDSIFSNNKNIVFWNADDDIDENGRLVTLKFKVLEDADSYDIQYKCSECYNSNRNYIEAELSNDNVDVIDPSTCNHIDEDNNDICDICGTSLSIFVGHSISLNGDIGVNFYVNVPDEDVDNGKVKVAFVWTVDNKENTYDVTLSSEDKTDNGYKASCPIAVAEMTYNITATVTNDGVVQGKADTYSAKKYAKVILNDEYNFKNKYILAENNKGRDGEQRYKDLVALVQNMLDYGTKAQIVFDRDTEHPANDGTDYFNDETYPVTSNMITVTEENMDMDLSAYGLRYKGSTVVYLSETSIRHYYYVDDWDSFNKIKNSVTFDGVSVGYTEKDGAIYFEKKGVSAANLDTPYSLTIKDKSCKFAVNDYIRHCLESTKVSDNTKALVKATYRYNQAANEYFSN